MIWDNARIDEQAGNRVELHHQGWRDRSGGGMERCFSDSFMAGGSGICLRIRVTR